MKDLNFLDKLELGLQMERLVIGIEEPILVKDLGEIKAKIDSGNGGYNVIHGEDIMFQGNYITFKTYDGLDNEKRLTKKVIEELEVHIGGGITQKRPVIELDVKFANEEYKKIPFSVTDRTKNSHRILISKDFVENTIEALIDVGAKNISNLSYDVDYKPVNEAKNEFGEMNMDGQSGKSTGKKVTKTVRPDGKEASFLDKVNDWANKWRPRGESQLQKKDFEEDGVTAWKKPSKVFANYAEFYKKDQKNIKEKILTDKRLIANLQQGNTSNMLIEGDKIKSNKLTGISVFSYLLKKGDAGPKGTEGEVIKGQEFRRELWFEYNNDCKKLIKGMDKKDKEEEKKKAEQEKIKKHNGETSEEGTTDFSTEFDKRRKKILDGETDENTGEIRVNDSYDFFSHKDYLVLEGAIETATPDATGKSFDVTDQKQGSKGVDNGENSKYNQEWADNVKSEADRILSLKGFICYYIPMYNGKDGAEAIKKMNGEILAGSFDERMSSFIEAGQGDDAPSANDVAKRIKEWASKNPDILEKNPGVFALCFSESLEVENGDRKIIFLNEIISDITDEEKLKQKLKELLGLPDEEEVNNENIDALKSLLETSDTTSPEEADLGEKFKKIIEIPEAQEATEENIKKLTDLLNGAGKKSSIDMNDPEAIKKYLTDTLGLPSEEKVDDDSIKALSKLLKSSIVKEKRMAKNKQIKDLKEKLKALLNLPEKIKLHQKTLVNVAGLLGKLIKGDIEEIPVETETPQEQQQATAEITPETFTKTFNMPTEEKVDEESIKQLTDVINNSIQGGERVDISKTGVDGENQSQESKKKKKKVTA